MHPWRLRVPSAMRSGVARIAHRDPVVGNSAGGAGDTLVAGAIRRITSRATIRREDHARVANGPRTHSNDNGAEDSYLGLRQNLLGVSVD